MRGAAPIFLTLLLTAAPAAAQVVTGSIEGHVTAPDSTPLSDAEVTVTGPSMPGPRTTRPDALGRFLVPLLPAGEYQVLVRRVGSRPVAYEAVPVRLATTVRLPPTRLETSPVVLEPLIVEASSLTLDFQSTAVQTSFGPEALDALPVDREFTAVAGLAPGANTSYYGDGVNFAGGTGTENTWFVDGINVTNPITGAPGMRLPVHLLQQVEIRSGVFDASLGQGLGTVINAVTPSGGNSFRMAGYGFFSGDALAAEAAAGQGQVTGFRDFEAGVSIGGPVSRDRLWFFAAYNPLLSHEDIRVRGVPDQTARNTLHAFAGKLTWRVGGATNVELTVLGDPATSEGVAGADSALSVDPLLTTTQTGGYNLSLRASHRVSPAVLLEATAQRYESKEETEGTTATGRSEPNFVDYTTGVGVTSGGVGMRSRLSGTRWLAGIQALVLVPRHTIRVGADLERTTGEVLFEGLNNSSGGFVSATGASEWSWFTFYAASKLANTAPSVFVQDAWQVHPRLLANVGVRWEQQRMEARNGSTMTLAGNLQPRLGLIYQPGQLGTTKVYASYGRFVERTALWLAGNLGPIHTSFETFDHDPRQDQLPTPVIEPPTPVHYEARAQAVHEISAGIEHPVSATMIAGIRGVVRDIEEVIEDGQGQTTWAIGNPGRGELVAFPRATRRYQALELTLRTDERSQVPLLVSYILSSTRGNYTGLYATDYDLPAAHGGPQFDFPEQLVNGTGLLPNDRTHMVRAVASRRFGSRFGVGTVLWWASGTPTSALAPIPGLGYIGFVTPRGSAGRTPAIWDLDIRLTWDLVNRGRTRGTLVVDIQHLPNTLTAVELEQQVELTTYGNPISYQPPRRVRAGLRVDF